MEVVVNIPGFVRVLFLFNILVTIFFLGLDTGWVRNAHSLIYHIDVAIQDKMKYFSFHHISVSPDILQPV